MNKTLRSGSVSALVMAACCLGTAAAAQSYTMMPPYPTDPKDYVVLVAEGQFCAP